MVMKRSALGRGLDALITMDDLKTGGSSSISEIELSKIQPNPDQPRRDFNEEELQALADSIGILSRGRLTAQGTAEELIRRTGQGSLEDAFVALTLDADTKGEWEGRP